jgi:hypothetical protein
MPKRISPEPRRILRRLKMISPFRLWLWRHIGNHIAGFLLYLYGHIEHWKVRDKWLREKGEIERLQRALAVISGIFGAVLCITPATGADNPFAQMVDGYGTGFLRLLGTTGEIAPGFLEPHRIFGYLLLGSGLAILVAIMEWPATADRQAAIDEEYEKNRLQKLMRLQQWGHLTGQGYWLVNFVMIAPFHPLWPLAWLSIFFAYEHYWLYQRVSKEYVRERDRALKAGAKRKRQDSPVRPARNPDEGLRA